MRVEIVLNWLKCAILYGQFITEMKNLMIIIVLERQNVKHSLFCEKHTFIENSF